MHVLLPVLIGIVLVSLPVSPIAASHIPRTDYGSTPGLGLEVFPGPAGAPVLVWITGGGWLLDLASTAQPFARTLASRGVTVVVPHYATGNAEAALADVAQAVKWARQLPGRGPLGLGGHSSGAQLAALAVALGRPPAVDSLLLVSGIYDLPGAVEDGGIAAQLVWEAFGPDRATWSSYSPTNCIQGPMPPTWIVHGTVDPDARLQRASAFAGQLVAAGTPVSWTAIPGVGHVESYEALLQQPALTDPLLAWLQTPPHRE